MSDADRFIDNWNEVFQQKVFQMPHLATRVLHTTIGLILRDVFVHFHGSYCDLRDSSLIMQDSGTGKKPSIEFLEEIVKHLGFNFRRRSSITSAGAVGTVVIEDIIDPETACKMKAPVVVYGDLKELDLLTCSEADSILTARIDSYGNDLLTNLCDSQDPNNLISKKLANGEVKPFTSHTSLFLTTTIPNSINPRWLEKGLFQRFGISIKHVTFAQYQNVRDEILAASGTKIDVSGGIKELAEALKSKPVPKEIGIQPAVRTELLEKAHALDKMLTDLNDKKTLDSVKSFTIRRDLKLLTCACHHAFLDERSSLNATDVNYAYSIIRESWQDILNFIGKNVSKVVSCSDAVLNLMNDGETRSTDEVSTALKKYTRSNVRYALSILVKKGRLNRLERDEYKKLES